jgi:hypothetical protein
MSVAGEFATEEEFSAIEAAVLETPRGRKFLAEFGRRCRNAETQSLLDAMKRIENVVTLRPQALAEPGETGLLAAAIKTTSADIAAIRNHMLEDGGAMPDDASIFSRIAEESRKLANDVMGEAERLKPDPGQDGECGAWWTLAWRLDVLSQRIAKAMALLAHIDSRIATLAPAEAAAIPDLAQKLAPENLKHFEEEEDLFEPPPPGAEPPPQDIRDRVVIIRRAAPPTIGSDNVA